MSEMTNSSVKYIDQIHLTSDVLFIWGLMRLPYFPYLQ